MHMNNNAMLLAGRRTSLRCNCNHARTQTWHLMRTAVAVSGRRHVVRRHGLVAVQVRRRLSRLRAVRFRACSRHHI
jgi:hypothetical protein